MVMDVPPQNINNLVCLQEKKRTHYYALKTAANLSQIRFHCSTLTCSKVTLCQLQVQLKPAEQ